MSPEEILKTTKNAGVSVLAITDHDVLDGSRELLRLAEDYDINCISGVELDLVEQGVNFHFLAYNIDLNNHRYDCVTFPEMKKACDIIHNAGGKAILAHPGRIIKTEKSIEFKNKLKSLT
jgi:predicted metal-dependent phosphoesterase TrpH